MSAGRFVDGVTRLVVSSVSSIARGSLAPGPHPSLRLVTGNGRGLWTSSAHHRDVTTDVDAPLYIGTPSKKPKSTKQRSLLTKQKNAVFPSSPKRLDLSTPTNPAIQARSGLGGDDPPPSSFHLALNAQTTTARPSSYLPSPVTSSTPGTRRTGASKVDAEKVKVIGNGNNKAASVVNGRLVVEDAQRNTPTTTTTTTTTTTAPYNPSPFNSVGLSPVTTTLDLDTFAKKIKNKKKKQKKTTMKMKEALEEGIRSSDGMKGIGSHETWKPVSIGAVSSTASATLTHGKNTEASPSLSNGFILVDGEGDHRSRLGKNKHHAEKDEKRKEDSLLVADTTRHQDAMDRLVETLRIGRMDRLVQHRLGEEGGRTKMDAPYSSSDLGVLNNCGSLGSGNSSQGQSVSKVPSNTATPQGQPAQGKSVSTVPNNTATPQGQSAQGQSVSKVPNNTATLSSHHQQVAVGDLKWNVTKGQRSRLEQARRSPPPEPVLSVRPGEIVNRKKREGAAGRSRGATSEMTSEIMTSAVSHGKTSDIPEYSRVGGTEGQCGKALVTGGQGQGEIWPPLFFPVSRDGKPEERKSKQHPVEILSSSAKKLDLNLNREQAKKMADRKKRAALKNIAKPRVEMAETFDLSTSYFNPTSGDKPYNLNKRGKISDRETALVKELKQQWRDTFRKKFLQMQMDQLVRTRLVTPKPPTGLLTPQGWQGKRLADTVTSEQMAPRTKRKHSGRPNKLREPTLASATPDGKKEDVHLLIKVSPTAAPLTDVVRRMPNVDGKLRVLEEVRATGLDHTWQSKPRGPVVGVPDVYDYEAWAARQDEMCHAHNMTSLADRQRRRGEEGEENTALAMTSKPFDGYPTRRSSGTPGVKKVADPGTMTDTGRVRGGKASKGDNPGMAWGETRRRTALFPLVDKLDGLATMTLTPVVEVGKGSQAKPGPKHPKNKKQRQKSAKAKSANQLSASKPGLTYQNPPVASTWQPLTNEMMLQRYQAALDRYVETMERDKEEKRKRKKAKKAMTKSAGRKLNENFVKESD